MSIIQKKISVIIMVILSISTSSVLDAKQAKNESTNMCPTTGYINSGHEVVIKEAPYEQSESIATIQNRQYICYFFETSPSQEWTKVKAIPFLDGVCKPNSSNEICKLSGNFPITWLTKKPKGKICKLNSFIDEGGNIGFKTTGICPTGWIHEKNITQIGD